MAQASTRERALEDIVEPDEQAIPLAPTECEVDAERRPHTAPGAQADPIVALEAPELVERRAYGPGVVEECAGHELVDSPAVLRLKERGRAVAVAERPVSAEASRA